MDNSERKVDERQLARVARRQHGLVTYEQTSVAGVSVSARRWRVRAGRWIVVAPGVVAIAGTAATWRQRTLGAALAAGPGAVASHTAAAALFNLSGCQFTGVEISVPRGRSHRSQLATVHETLHLSRCDVTVTDHIPVTTPARTLVDLAGCVSERALEDAVDDALTRGLTTLARLQRCAARLETGRSGATRLASVLARWADGDSPEGVAEMRLVRRLVANGLPAPVLQYEVRDGAGKVVARVDMAYPNERVAIELEGFRWHGTPRGQARDKARLRRLSALGWLVIPATPADLAADGALVARQVEAARTHRLSTRTAG